MCGFIWGMSNTKYDYRLLSTFEHWSGRLTHKKKLHLESNLQNNLQVYNSLQKCLMNLTHENRFKAKKIPRHIVRPKKFGGLKPLL